MLGLGEITLKVVWKLLPPSVKESLTSKLVSAQRRSEIAVPESDVLVYAKSPEVRALYKDLLAPDTAENAPHSPAPAYSLVLTVYNEADTIRELLDSVQRQTIPPVEIVICDGGSTDRTLAVIEEWKTAHQPETFPVIVLELEQAAIAEGRNKAAAAASKRSCAR